MDAISGANDETLSINIVNNFSDHQNMKKGEKRIIL